MHHIKRVLIYLCGPYRAMKKHNEWSLKTLALWVWNALPSEGLMSPNHSCSCPSLSLQFPNSNHHHWKDRIENAKWQKNYETYNLDSILVEMGVESRKHLPMSFSLYRKDCSNVDFILSVSLSLLAYSPSIFSLIYKFPNYPNTIPGSNLLPYTTVDLLEGV